MSEMTEGELYWVEYRDVYHLAKLLNIKDDEEPHAYGVNLVTLQKVRSMSYKLTRCLIMVLDSHIYW